MSVQAADVRVKIQERIGAIAEGSAVRAAGIDLSSLIGIVADVIKDGQFTWDDLDPVITGVREAFDAIILPINVPGLPDSIKQIAVSAMKATIPHLVAALFRLILGEKPGTPGST